ncbi:copper homeostasis protein CutC [Paenibacillus yanchengensis]|uniref:PF03932 family protein CutC n=1 Tax=Paenibacillus yanchengensis TaxID=2035833 RepID=A0ABW4YGS2_9BACL
MLIEVIATNIADVHTASASGADRIELVTGIQEGGLTPSAAMIAAAVTAATIPVQVMIRPHSQSFCYSSEDLQIMRNDIQIAKDNGAAGVVLGVLNEQKEIDQAALESLLKVAAGLKVTFHRAFDELDDQFAGLDVLSQYKGEIAQILTSGGKPKAIDALEQLAQLQIAAAKHNIAILGGRGLSPENSKVFVEHTKVKQVHYGSAVRYNNSFMEAINPERIAQIRSIVK